MLARRFFVDESRNATGIINQDKYPPLIGDGARRVQHCVRERQFEVRDFLRVSLARFVDGLDLTAEGPLEECRGQGGVLAHGSGLNLSVPPSSTRLGASGDGCDDWDDGNAPCSTSGWTTGGIRNIPAEARSTVRPALSASSANSFRAAASAATSTGMFVAPLSIRTTVATPKFIFAVPSA